MLHDQPYREAFPPFHCRPPPGRTFVGRLLPLPPVTSAVVGIVPPLPAVSRPSNTMQTLRPGGRHPFLQCRQLGLQRGQLGFVFLALQLLSSGTPAAAFLSSFLPSAPPSSSAEHRRSVRALLNLPW
jgi:hypothetical protein